MGLRQSPTGLHNSPRGLSFKAQPWFFQNKKLIFSIPLLRFRFVESTYSRTRHSTKGISQCIQRLNLVFIYQPWSSSKWKLSKPSFFLSYLLVELLDCSDSTECGSFIWPASCLWSFGTSQAEPVIFHFGVLVPGHLIGIASVDIILGVSFCKDFSFNNMSSSQRFRRDPVYDQSSYSLFVYTIPTWESSSSFKKHKFFSSKVDCQTIGTHLSDKLVTNLWLLSEKVLWKSCHVLVNLTNFCDWQMND